MTMGLQGIEKTLVRIQRAIVRYPDPDIEAVNRLIMTDPVMSIIKTNDGA